MEVPRLEVESELQLLVYATAIAATCGTYTATHSNAGSLTYSVRPGIKPVSSWIQVAFVSAAPQRELQDKCLRKKLRKFAKSTALNFPTETRLK